MIWALNRQLSRAMVRHHGPRPRMGTQTNRVEWKLGGLQCQARTQALGPGRLLGFGLPFLARRPGSGCSSEQDGDRLVA